MEGVCYDMSMTAIHFTSRTKTAIIWVAILLALGFLYLLRPIVTPFIWGMITAYILNAGVIFALHRAGGPRWLWVMIFYFGTVAGLVWGLMAAGPVLAGQVQQLINDLPNYLKQVEQ